MNVTVKTQELRDALKKTDKVSTNTVLPVLYYDKLESTGAEVILTRTDTERAITVRIPANGGDKFTVLIPRKKLIRFTGDGKGDTEISVVDKKVVVTRPDIGKIATSIIYKPDEFPPIPTDTELLHRWADAGRLIKYIGYVAPACAKEESRPVLTGVSFSDGCMAAVDGFRLNVFQSDDVRLEKNIIVPAKSLALVKDLFKPSETLKVEYNDNRIYFVGDTVTLVSQLIHGTFPQVKQLIPGQGCPTTVTVSAPLMVSRLNMIDKDIVVARYEYRHEAVGDVCQITSGFDDDNYDGFDDDNYELFLPVKIEGLNNKIALNYSYILDALKSFSIADISVYGQQQPIKITGDIEGLTIVVMPMFVQW